MTRYFIIILLLSATVVYSQTNLVGQWVRVFNIENGKKIKPAIDKIDTLDFFADKKFLRRQNGLKETATWSFDSKKKTIKYKNYVSFITIDGKPIDTMPVDSHHNIGKITKDSLVINTYSEKDHSLISTQHYFRIK